MANILDIFRTHTGKKLLESAGEETGLSEKELQRVFLFGLPFIISVHRSQCDNGNNNLKELTEGLQEIDLTNSSEVMKKGEVIFPNLLSNSRREKFIALSRSFGIDEKPFEQSLKISTGVIFGIIAQVTSNKNLKREDHCKLLDTLSGFSSVYEQELVKVFTRHDDSGNLIKTEEEIALGRENDHDQSILGGYSGGR